MSAIKELIRRRGVTNADLVKQTMTSDLQNPSLDSEVTDSVESWFKEQTRVNQDKSVTIIDSFLIPIEDISDVIDLIDNLSKYVIKRSSKTYDNLIVLEKTNQYVKLGSIKQ